MGWIKANPTRAAAIGMVLIGWLALIDVPGLIITGLGTILGIVTGTTVWGAVTPVAKAAAAATEAAAAAATQTAERLDESVVGPVGVVTGAAANLVAEVAAGAGQQVARLLGGRGPAHRG